jgi:hypothetical protein
MFEHRQLQQEDGNRLCHRSLVSLSTHCIYPKVVHNQYSKKHFSVQPMYWWRLSAHSLCKTLDLTDNLADWYSFHRASVRRCHNHLRETKKVKCLDFQYPNTYYWNRFDLLNMAVSMMMAPSLELKIILNKWQSLITYWISAQHSWIIGW